ncbi:PadR family transcriptional regulator [Priestia aryabhattai]|jgi:DNA-binding PadR family transcriptional regulator|uniref:PadR family transcriptional regulator n=1 Tax=Priestia TaxID=2800373 RepID=UPI0004A2563F|nr:PadR family transcriptional regulator [Priestia aryabhattai]MBK0006264.1 PadR family transcriptional regulator [Bacillus sp. S35]SDE46087.1 transcriptional regulator, PadR family [Priestia aryabhattai B8W22]MCM3254864.1 PadR family transcriptional regulator [Priestia aryabhattai]MCM3639866.1 PadR family transcriptional regulator [Priestia aryabhattai]PFW79678.1 PadR family transcriptional regulator [Priestia aryabhattai]
MINLFAYLVVLSSSCVSNIINSNIITMKNEIKKSPLALAILCLLIEEPMHPYRMQQLIKERGKDEVINVRYRNSIYQTIDRLHRDRAIVIQEKKQNEGRPDLIVYEVTEEGREAAYEWIRGMLSTPKQEFLEFPAAISFLALLTPEDVRKQLQKRVLALEKTLAYAEKQMEIAISRGIPRLFLLEVEYLRTMSLAELEWSQSIIDDIQGGKLKWDWEWLREISLYLTSKEEPMD